MTPLLTFAPGWNLEVPAGTLLIRADVVMNQRPGAGGFAAIIEAADLTETVLVRGGIPDGTTDDLIKMLIGRLAVEIKGNRAVVITRSPPVGRELSTVFKRFKMIRMVLNSPLAVADATRHAAVMAERAERTKEAHMDRLLSARYEPSEDHSETQDTGIVHSAIQTLLRAVSGADLSKNDVSEAAQGVLDAAEKARLVRQRQTIQSLTANDIPKMTKET